MFSLQYKLFISYISQQKKGDVFVCLVNHEDPPPLLCLSTSIYAALLLYQYVTLKTS